MKLQSTLAIELHTTQGLEKNFDYKKVLKAFKKGRSSAEDEAAEASISHGLATEDVQRS